jgi:hypothetical protein
MWGRMSLGADWLPEAGPMSLTSARQASTRLRDDVACFPCSGIGSW